MKDDLLYVDHIRDAIEHIFEYTKPGKDHFFGDAQCQDAVMMNFGIIGEATKRMSSERKDRYPEMPWKKIVTEKTLLVPLAHIIQRHATTPIGRLLLTFFVMPEHDAAHDHLLARNMKNLRCLSMLERYPATPKIHSCSSKKDVLHGRGTRVFQFPRIPENLFGCRKR